MVQELPGVRFLEERSVCGLTVTRGQADGHRRSGARPGRRPARPRSRASLVVDATGRGSRTPVWLAELGYQRPAQERVEIGLGYATRTYRLRPGAMDGDQLILTAGTPANPRGRVPRRHRGRPPHADHRRHLRRLPAHRPARTSTPSWPGCHTADIAAAIAGAEPLDDPVPFRFPASVRHRYERLTASRPACWSSATPFARSTRSTGRA